MSAAPTEPLLRSTPTDRYFDYCLQPYRPRRDTRKKLRAENLLWTALEIAGLREAARPALEALRASLGRDMVVWGTKFDGQRLFFELYIYDPQKQCPAATVSGIRRALAPTLTLTPEVHAAVPYIMVSFDLNQEVFNSRRVPELNLYLTGTDAHAGRSYLVSARGTELMNTYRFLAPKPDINTVLGLVKSSAFIDYESPRTLGQVLIPQLFACKRICVAKKRTRDGVYYSGIAAEELLWFLRRFGYPAALSDFLARHLDEFDHLYFDVGLDLEQLPDGTIEYPKTSFYGTF